jgi:hypothetical protein
MTGLEFEDQITNTSIEPLSAIKVAIIDEKIGTILEIITLEEFVRVGNSQDLWMRNFAGFGDVEYELTASNADNLINKVAYLRNQQKRNRKVGAVDG